MDKYLKEIGEVKKAAIERMITLALAGLGLVAALAWNEAIGALFNLIFKERGSILAKFVYAIIITVVVVIVSSRLSKIFLSAEEAPSGPEPKEKNET